MRSNFCRFDAAPAKTVWENSAYLAIIYISSEIELEFRSIGFRDLTTNTESKRMVSGFLGKELLRKELRVRVSCSPL